MSFDIVMVISPQLLVHFTSGLYPFVQNVLSKTEELLHVNY